MNNATPVRNTTSFDVIYKFLLKNPSTSTLPVTPEILKNSEISFSDEELEVLERMSIKLFEEDVDQQLYDKLKEKSDDLENQEGWNEFLDTYKDSLTTDKKKQNFEKAYLEVSDPEKAEKLYAKLAKFLKSTKGIPSEKLKEERSKVQDKKDLEVFNQIKDKYLINMLEKDQVKEELRLNYQAVVDKDIFEANLSQTVEDQAVGILFRNLKTSDKYDSLELDDATKKSLKDHKISMAAENFLGEFLERYLKEKLEQHSWHWCCNSLVNAVDFIKENDDETFVLLQVKNSSNTENSSSSKVRVNTTIKKWYRRKASNGQVCWDKFPDKDAIQDLSEESFLQWISELNISVKDTE
jgi:hypothetical protein